MAAAASAVRSVFRLGSVRYTAARVASQAKATPSPFRIGTKKPMPLRSFRSPVELSFCVESMLPFYSASASALLTSMLSISSPNFSRISKDH